MEDWKHKVALITDYDDELGVEFAKELANAGLTIIGFVKATGNHGTTEDLKKISSSKLHGKIITYECDITNLLQLETIFKEILHIYKGVDVLVNNANLNLICSITNGNIEDFRKIIDANIYALVACTKLAVGSMIERDNQGIIINITDTNSYEIPDISRNNIYLATNGTVRSINEILRHEFRYLEANIKVTNIVFVRNENAKESKARLEMKDVAYFIRFILNAPQLLQIHELFLEAA